MSAINFTIKEKFSLKENSQTEKEDIFVDQIKEKGVPQSFKISMDEELDT